MKIYAIEYGYDTEIVGYYSTVAKAEIAISEMVASDKARAIKNFGDTNGLRFDLYSITEIEVN